MSGDMQRDSRLEAFLRRASAIIAAEKGLTPFARAKLDELARGLHLPDDLLQAGIEQLQDSNAPIASLTDYEAAFLQFLAREFTKMRSGDVLSIAIEEKAIAHANSRYGIARHRAEQLIDYQANLSGIGRLSRSDAREFGRQMILEIVADQQSLSTADQQRVDRIRMRWGCEAEEVGELVERKLRQNEIASARAQRRPLVLASLVLLTLVGFVAGGKWIHDNFDRVFAAKPVHIDPVPPNFDVATEPVRPKSELELAFSDLANSIVSPDPATRGSAIAIATERVLEGSDRQQEQKLLQRKLVGDWFLKDASPLVAKGFLRTIESSLQATPETSRSDALKIPYRAASWAIELCDARDRAPAQVEPLLRLLEKQVGNGLRSETAPQRSVVSAAVAAAQWNQLIDQAYHEPARCSILIEPLAELTESKLPKPEQQQFLNRALRTIILADRDQWRNMKQPILSAIRASDESQRMEWIDIWIDAFDGEREFREFAAEVLLAGFPEPVSGEATGAEDRLRADRSAWRNKKFEVALQRQRQIQQRVEGLEPYLNSSSSRVNPDVIYQAALLGNLCLEAVALMDSGRAGQESAWSDVDAQLDRYELRLREFVSLDDETGEPPISSAGFDTTLRDRTLNALSDLSKENRPLRLAAIERLPKLTERFRSIPQASAETLGRYILAPHDAEEYLKLQRVLPSLVAWPKMVLAVSDQLVEEQASEEQASEEQASEEQLRRCFTLLTGRSADAGESLSKAAMAMELLQLSNELLLAQEEVGPSSAASDWLRLRKVLQRCYWQRARLLATDPSLPNVSLIDNLRSAAMAGADRVAVTRRAIGLIESEADNELQQVLLLNQLMLGEKLSLPEPETELTLGARLLRSELSLLQQWNRRRERQLKGIVDEF